MDAVGVKRDDSPLETVFVDPKVFFRYTVQQDAGRPLLISIVILIGGLMMKCNNRLLFFAGTIFLLIATGRAETLDAERSASATDALTIRLVTEAGFLGVVDHRIAFAEGDRPFRYHEEGGQDVLFPFSRFSVELDAGERHTAVFLYQPLALETQVAMPEELEIDGETFSGDSLRLLYSFPFYRLSYLYRFYARPGLRMAAGASLQIRNATTEFEARGGTDAGGFYRSAGTGPVPLVKVRIRYDLPRQFWLGMEVDGMYAPISYINGSDNDTIGALLDGAVRAGYTVISGLDTFIGVRYLGGGAANEDSDDYTVNWLHVTTVSLGAALTLR